MSPERNVGHAGAGDMRPLSARSVIASLLLGSEVPSMPGDALVRWCALFGVAEGTARVALSRMAAAGELVADHGSYALAGTLAERRTFQDWSLHPELEAWRGDWRIDVVTGPRRSARARAALRTAMARSRMAEMREGVWIRPANLSAHAVPASARKVVEAQCSAFLGRPEGDASALADRLFDPVGWARRAHTLLGDVTAVTDDIDAGAHRRLADGFTTGAAVLAHIRVDPLLPPGLLPPDFPGDDLRDGYLRFQTVYRRETRAWFRAQAEVPRRRA